MSYESYDPELIEAIESFLRREKDGKGEIALSADQVRESVRDYIKRGQDLEAFISQEALIHDVQTVVVTREQRTVKSEELTALAANTINRLLSPRVYAGSNKEISLVRRRRGREELSVTLMGKAIPSFLSADYIGFESYRPNRVEGLPSAPKTLGIIGEVEPFSRLIIGSPAGALTDSQTRTLMEHVISEFPDVVERYLNETSYYFFRDRIGKAIYLPTRLLGPRALQPEEGEESEPSSQALSNITAGDLALAKIGLLAVRNSISSKPPATMEWE